MVSGTLDRATRLVTPGGEVEDVGLKPGATTASRKVPQRIDRRRSEARGHRTGKPVRRLRNARIVWQGGKGGVRATAPVMTPGARKTPRGARPNRRGEPARLTDSAFRKPTALRSLLP